MDEDKNYVVMRREDGLPCYYFKAMGEEDLRLGGVLYKEKDFDAPVMWTACESGEEKLITLTRVDK